MDVIDSERKVILHDFSVTQEKINQFGKVTGGEGKIHTSPEYAEQTIFKKTLVHGLFLQAFLEMETCRYFLKGIKKIETTFLKPVTVDQKFDITFEPLSKNYYKVFIESKGKKCVISNVTLE